MLVWLIMLNFKRNIEDNDSGFWWLRWREIFETTFGHVIKSSKLRNSGMSIIIVVLFNIITFS
jgi:hypothetical protein